MSTQLRDWDRMPAYSESEKVSSFDHLQADFRWYIEVRNILLIFVPIPVLEVLSYLFQHDATDGGS